MDDLDLRRIQDKFFNIESSRPKGLVPIYVSDVQLLKFQGIIILTGLGKIWRQRKAVKLHRFFQGGDRYLSRIEEVDAIWQGESNLLQFHFKCARIEGSIPVDIRRPIQVQQFQVCIFGE